MRVSRASGYLVVAKRTRRSRPGPIDPLVFSPSWTRRSPRSPWVPVDPLSIHGAGPVLLLGIGPADPHNYAPPVGSEGQVTMPYEGYSDFFGKKMILTVAPTGGLHGKEANPNLPEQPEEIAEDVAACREAGASVVHVHARDEGGEPTKEPAKFQEIRDAIEDRVDDIVFCFTTGGRGSREELIRPSLDVEPHPELATIDLGPLNSGRNRTATNVQEKNEEYARRMREHGIKPELEAFNPGHLTEAYNLIEQDLLDPPYWSTVILGMQTGTVPRPRNLRNFVDNLPEETEWQCMAIGKHQLPLTTMAMTLGGHVRVGMEDNVYYRRGEPAESNAQLVRRTARIAEELARPLATPDEAREMMGIE